MYNKKYVGLLTALLGIGLMLAFTMFWGCSDSSISPTVIQGDLSDPEFLAIRPSLDDAVDSAIYGAFSPLTNPHGFPLDSSTWQDKLDFELGPMGPDDSADYTYEGGWHVMYVSHLSASGTEVFYDSLGFFVNSSPWMMLTDDVNIVRYRGSYELSETEGETADEYIITARMDFEDVNTVASVGTGTMVITSNSIYTEGTSTMDETFDFEITIGPLTYNRPTTGDWESFETIEGEVNITLTYTLEGGTETIDQEWTIEITLEDDVAHVEATKGNTVWSFDHDL
jgi:hypothetical protein